MIPLRIKVTLSAFSFISACSELLMSTGLLSLAQIQMKLTSYGAISNGTITDFVNQVCKITTCAFLPILLTYTDFLISLFSFSPPI